MDLGKSATDLISATFVVPAVCVGFDVLGLNVKTTRGQDKDSNKQPYTMVASAKRALWFAHFVL